MAEIFTIRSYGLRAASEAEPSSSRCDRTRSYCGLFEREVDGRRLSISRATKPLTARYALFTAWLAVLASIFVSAASLKRPALAQTGLDELRALALDLVNTSRREHRLPPLRLDARLTQAAQFHAEDMLKRNYYSHNSPEGKTVGDRFQQAGGGRWVLTAENIAKCDGCAPPLGEAYVRRMHDGWMNSPGHRANILREGLTGFGYGLAASDGGALYAVQTFSGPGTPGGGTAANGGRELKPSDQAEAALCAINDKRKAGGKPPLELSDALTEAARGMLPKPGGRDFGLPEGDDLHARLSQGQSGDWASLAMLAGVCGGCGATPVKADIAFFTGQWFGQPSYAKMLMDPEMTHLGFAIGADGQGKKLALGLLGARR